MELTAIQQAALKRWHDFGPSAPTHPLLQTAYELYLQPFGLKCESMTYDALAALENKELTLTFTKPVFDPTLIDRNWSQFNLVDPLIPLLDRLDPVFNEQGLLTDFVYLRENGAEDPSLKTFEEKHAAPLFDLSQALIAAAKLYIDTSLELLLQGPAVDEMARIFNDTPRRYGALTFHLLTSPIPQE